MTEVYVILVNERVQAIYSNIDVARKDAQKIPGSNVRTITVHDSEVY